MCGIAGVVSIRDAELGDAQRQTVRKMCAAMGHRGPDDEGYLDRPTACLGMRRLSIIDVAHGAQPVFNEDGNVSAVFNGEIYNYQALQAVLRSAQHRLGSNSDSDCIPHLYEEHGVEFVRHLRGMFAIAIWDEKNRRLILVRDRVGKKPLYYYDDGHLLWFASELKCLLQVPGLRREVDPVAIDHYLTFQYIPHPRTALKGVCKIPPGHFAVVDNGAVSVERYWQLKYPDADAITTATEDDLAEELREHILDATRVRMVSERPLGAFLSGGLDSSAVVAAMSRVGTGSVSTFSIGFEEEAYNELPYARQVASLYGTDHHELVVKPDVCAILPQLARMFDEPFADSSAVPSFYLAQMARRDVVVVLNGDGGDESLGGYHRYASFLRSRRFVVLPDRTSRAGQRLARSISGRWPQSRTMSRASSILHRASAGDPVQRYLMMMSYFHEFEKRSMYRPDFASRVGPEGGAAALLGAAWRQAGRVDDVNRVLSTDVEMYLPGDLLTKVDITTMAVSLEARSPLLDHQLMEWSARLPGNLKVRDTTTKYLFKKAVADWLPSDLIHRRKMGFGIPRGEWLQGPLAPMVRDLLLSKDTRISTYLEPASLRALVGQLANSTDAASRVWALLMLELWHREVLEA